MKNGGSFQFAMLVITRGYKLSWHHHKTCRITFLGARPVQKGQEVGPATSLTVPKNAENRKLPKNCVKNGRYPQKIAMFNRRMMISMISHWTLAFSHNFSEKPGKRSALKRERKTARHVFSSFPAFEGLNAPALGEMWSRLQPAQTRFGGKKASISQYGNCRETIEPLVIFVSQNQSKSPAWRRKLQFFPHLVSLLLRERHQKLQTCRHGSVPYLFRFIHIFHAGHINIHKPNSGSLKNRISTTYLCVCGF